MLRERLKIPPLTARMSGAVVDLVCSDQLSRGLRAWQARLRHPAGRLLGDCDLMRSTSASRTCQRWSGDARSATSVKRADGTALSVIVVLFDHHKSLRNHRDTRTLEQYYPIYSIYGSYCRRNIIFIDRPAPHHNVLFFFSFSIFSFNVRLNKFPELSTLP